MEIQGTYIGQFQNHRLNNLLIKSLNWHIIFFFNLVDEHFKGRCTHQFSWHISHGHEKVTVHKLIL